MRKSGSCGESLRAYLELAYLISGSYGLVESLDRGCRWEQQPSFNWFYFECEYESIEGVHGDIRLGGNEGL